MKKVLIFAGLAAIAVLGSCNRENIPADETIAGEKVILSVTDAPWTDETRSAYTSGTGVKLTGTEPISLYYYKDKIYNSNIKATAASAGQYSFTMPAAAEGSTLWYGILPYSRYLASLNSAGTTAVLRLGPVQFPAADSFDPQFDWLVAKPFTVDGTSGDKNGEIVAFKRLFAPLCLTVTGLPAGSKIYTATLAFSQEPTNTQALSGLFYVKMSELYAETNISSAEKTSMSNAISAEYGSGLEAIGSGWPVWFMVNPITIASGGTMTVTVSTGDRTYSRIVALADEKTIDCEAINRISFNVCGEGYTSRGSVTQDFAYQTLGGTKVLTASDGSSISWVTTTTREFRASDDGGSFVKGGLLMNNTSFTFPTIAGKNIVGARIFAHPSSRSNAGASVILTVDGTDEYVFNLAQSTLAQSVAYKGGYIDIALPTGKSSLAGLTVSASNQQHVISAITLFTEDTALDPDDYYAQYMAGNDITINGEVFNKATYGTPRLVKAYEMANANEIVADATSKGILFLDWDPADGKEDVFKAAYNIRPATTVIIGRYRTHQPHLDLSAGSYAISPTGSKLVLKNVCVTTKNYSFMTGNATQNVTLSFEDCTINALNNFVFAESNASYGFASITVSNSVIKMTKALYGYTSAWTAGSTLAGLTKMSFENTVIYAESLITYPSVALKTSGAAYLQTPNADFNFDHVTFYNIESNNYGVLGLYNMAKVNVNYCAGEAALTKASPLVIIPAALSPTISDSKVSGNYFNSTNDSFTWAYGYSALTNSGVSVSANNFMKGTSPFTSVNTTTGYFPVNTTVVTNGAGASYSTKLWKTWE